MSVTLALISALALTAPQQGPEPQDAPAELGEVVVDGRRIEQLAREFIEDVAAPTNRRGLARWNTPLCVGVVNLRRDAAQAIVDRISDIAGALEVPLGQPGCRANALIVATEDGAGMATAMVQARRRAFDPGSSQITQSDEALTEFTTDQRPVRWWQMSLPVNSENGERAIRLPGDASPPVIAVFAASRINSQIRDDMNKVIVIVDLDEVEGLNTTQLADYLAMVTLAQIDARGDTGGYDTVLNLFQNREGITGLTDWDRAYLAGLYAAEQNRINPINQARNVADAAVRARRAQIREQGAAD